MRAMGQTKLNRLKKQTESMVMKKNFLFTALLACSMALYSQTSQDGKCVIENLIQAKMVRSTDVIGNFTITDSDGHVWNLYEQLDLGKTVFLDFFYSS